MKLARQVPWFFLGFFGGEVVRDASEGVTQGNQDCLFGDKFTRKQSMQRVATLYGDKFPRKQSLALWQWKNSLFLNPPSPRVTYNIWTVF